MTWLAASFRWQIRAACVCFSTEFFCLIPCICFRSWIWFAVHALPHAGHTPYSWVMLCFSPQWLHVLGTPWAEARAVPAGPGARTEWRWAAAGLWLEPPSQVQAGRDPALDRLSGRWLQSLTKDPSHKRFDLEVCLYDNCRHRPNKCSVYLHQSQWREFLCMKILKLKSTLNQKYPKPASSSFF